jgi:uncharacterized protein
MYQTILLLISLLAIAFIFSSVGHGGASGYLAMMAIFGVAPAFMKSSALVLNVFVSAIAFVQFYNQGHFKWKLFLAVALLSVPAAYFGATIPLSDAVYKKVLGVVLLIPIIRLFGLFGGLNGGDKKFQWYFALGIGASIGLLSGMIGIGGGIILSPIILMLGWTNQKEAAAISAPFILVNSIAGIIAIVDKPDSFSPMVFPWVFVGIIGGLMGSYLGSKLYSNATMNKVLAIVLLIASLKLIFS